MLCPPSSCSRDPVRQIADGRISWAKAEEEFQVFDMATEWGPSSRRSRSDRICRARDLGRNVPDRILDLERAFPELANLPPVGDHRPSPVWFPVSWISSCPHLPPIRQMLRALYPQIRCLEDLEHVTPRGPVPRESTAEAPSESASSAAWESADDDSMSDGSSPTESTDLGGMTPPEATSQYDFDIQLGFGKRFTCRVGSREARSEWIQAIEVARSSGIPDCPLYDPTDPQMSRTYWQTCGRCTSRLSDGKQR